MMATHDSIPLIFVVSRDDDDPSCITVYFLCAFEFVFGKILLIWRKEVLDSYIL